MGNTCSRERVKGFLRTQGTWMVNGDGEKIVLRGYGIGNWTNPEGFMVGGTRGFAGEYNRPQLLDRARSMDWLIQELCGSEYAKEFWPKWYRNFFNESDIKALAELGYNSVRLVLNGAAFLKEEPGIHFVEDTFSMLDQVLDWCEQYGLYAILDLHAAPGGQSCGGCDNGVDNVPHLFLDEENWERTIVLWEEFARRYKDRWIVGGYDLLNEPLNNESWFYLKEELKSFYDELISRIRAIDKVHMLTIEGCMWSTMMDIFDHDYDPQCHNWCIHIHNYGFRSEFNEMMAALDRSEELQVPIWLGEGGSDKVDHAVFLEGLAKIGVGYALWSWKASKPIDGKERGNNFPVLFQPPEGWDQVYAYADHGGPKPGYAKAQAIFDQLLENIRYENCQYNREISAYNLRHPGITIPGAGYDMGYCGEAFSGNWLKGNAFEFRLSDHTKLVRKPGAPIVNPQGMLRFFKHFNPMDVGGSEAIENLWLELTQDEFAQYTVRDVKKPCRVSVELYPLEDSMLNVSAESLNHSVSVAGGKPLWVDALELPEGELWIVRLTVLYGRVQIANVKFHE